MCGMSEIYEVHVSEQHWAEGCALGTAGESKACPVYTAMCEAGLPVSSVGPYHWTEVSEDVEEEWPLPFSVGQAIREFDQGRLPAPLTFTVTLG